MTSIGSSHQPSRRVVSGRFLLSRFCSGPNMARWNSHSMYHRAQHHADGAQGAQKLRVLDQRRNADGVAGR